ncbi:16S rRNA (guanine(966)-N(2))-methyltransferase RsmD [Neorickettsia sp. 179522]|uniref:16S rRNA (guanine(966)-N(2))-methyltransferase RsmD n=1 Tax=Neorickettsia sp. 179522 TaxID=1714371 RepID=UPI00079419D1|nr:16S rRNA (guanine(966)-N(2))-methyltransferase RsmD [Neorickettsia sp. 179522]KYH12335.1 16S rRNA (guanine(966)-N(2))-methyltransferase RsmD [Neorickettsia sp. 179522]
MRVIAGKYKERKIGLIKGVDIRPTMGKVREALFNIILHARFVTKVPEEIHFLDLFTGTGSVSIEALSRGFASVTAVDIDTRCIYANLEKMAIHDEITVISRDVVKLEESGKQYDVVFMDPPYNEKTPKYRASQITEKSFAGLHERGWLCAGSIVILEKHKKEIFKLNHHAFELIDSRRYGMSELLTFVYIGHDLPLKE